MENLITSLGLMSGTSLDGIDASIISSDGEEKIEILDNKFVSYSSVFRKKLSNYIKKIHSNTMYRALRCDKLTLALMEKILRGYSNGFPGKENLAYQMLITPRNILRRRGERLLLSISRDIINKLKI